MFLLTNSSKPDNLPCISDTAHILKAQLKRTKFFSEFSMITWTTQEKYYSSYVS